MARVGFALSCIAKFTESGALRSIEVMLFALAIAGEYFLSAGIMGGTAKLFSENGDEFE